MINDGESLSETLSTGSTSTDKGPRNDEPPTFSDVLNNLAMFHQLLQFLSSRYLAQNLVFVEQTAIFAQVNRPQEELVREAQRIIWWFVVPGAQSEVRMSPVERDRLCRVVYEANGAALVTRTLFTQAAFEVKTSLFRGFHDWLGTGEWRSVPFNRAEAPSFEVVLKTPDLVSLLRKYLRRTDSAQSRIALDLVKFCCAAEEFKNEVYMKRDTEEAAAKAERVAKKIVKRYSHVIDSTKPKNLEYSVYLLATLDIATIETNEKPFFKEWLTKKEWVGTDFAAVSLHQSKDPSGFQEYPTLAACFGSPQLLSLIVSFLHGTQRQASILFLVDLLKITRQSFRLKKSLDTAKNADLDSSTATDEGSARSDGDEDDSDGSSYMTKEEVRDLRAKLVEEARAIFQKYLDGAKPLVSVHPKLVSQLKGQLFGFRSKSKFDPEQFWRVGAYVFHRVERTWFRELQSTYAWALKEYDNHCVIAEYISRVVGAQSFEGIPLNIVPLPDDVVENKSLFDSFLEVLPADRREALLALLGLMERYRKKPADVRREYARKVLDAAKKFDTDSGRITKAAAAVAAVLNDFKGADLSTDLLAFLKHITLECVFAVYYPQWVAAHKAEEFNAMEWRPAAFVTFSQLPTIVAIPDIISMDDQRTSAVKRSFFSKMFVGRKTKLAKNAPVVSQTPAVSSGAQMAAALQGAGDTRGRSGSTSGPSAGNAHEQSPLRDAHTPLGLEDSTSELPVMMGTSSSELPAVDVSGNSTSSNNKGVDGAAGAGAGGDGGRSAARPADSDDDEHGRRGREPMATRALAPVELTVRHVNMTLRAPTLDETLGSTYLREMFGTTFLAEQLLDDEFEMWEALTQFYARYHVLRDTELKDQQLDLVRDAKSILEKYGELLRHTDALTKDLASPLITANFFHQEEVAIYSRFYQSYQQLLIEQGFAAPL